MPKQTAGDILWELYEDAWMQGHEDITGKNKKTTSEAKQSLHDSLLELIGEDVDITPLWGGEMSNKAVIERAIDKIKITISFEANKLPKFTLDSSEAVAQINELIVKERIDELIYLSNHADPLVLDRVYIAERIKSLNSLLEQDSIQDEINHHLH
jgi:hypothetical protein